MEVLCASTLSTLLLVGCVSAGSAFSVKKGNEAFTVILGQNSISSRDPHLCLFYLAILIENIEVPPFRQSVCIIFFQSIGNLRKL